LPLISLTDPLKGTGEKTIIPLRFLTAIFFPERPAPRRSSPGRHPATPRRAPPAAFRRARTRAAFRSPLVHAHGCARACSPPRFTAHEAAAGRRGGSGHRAPPPRGSAAMARRAQAQGARRSSPPPGSPAAREEDKEGRRRARRQRSSLSGEGGGARWPGPQLACPRGDASSPNGEGGGARSPGPQLARPRGGVELAQRRGRRAALARPAAREEAMLLLPPLRLFSPSPSSLSSPSLLPRRRARGGAKVAGERLLLPSSHTHGAAPPPSFPPPARHRPLLLPLDSALDGAVAPSQAGPRRRPLPCLASRRAASPRAAPPLLGDGAARGHGELRGWRRRPEPRVAMAGPATPPAGALPSSSERCRPARARLPPAIRLPSPGRGMGPLWRRLAGRRRTASPSLLPPAGRPRAPPPPSLPPLAPAMASYGGLARRLRSLLPLPAAGARRACGGDAEGMNLTCGSHTSVVVERGQGIGARGIIVLLSFSLTAPLVFLTPMA